MPSIKKNFLYSSFLTTANYLFPMLTYPYVARVLGVERMGLCNFADSIISYFILLSFMGMNTVGIREIARAKGDKAQLDKVYGSLFALNTVSTAIAVAALLVATLCVPQLYANKELMAVGGVRLLMGYMQVEWLFKGLEDFKYITLRTLSIKVLYVASVFVLVRGQDDYIVYFALYTAMVAVNAVVNVWYARRFVRLSFKGINVRPFVKPFLTLGFYMFLTSMYSSFNVAFLGFTAGETEVGYYTTATKLYGILLSLFTAFTGVMLPRMSSLLTQGKEAEFQRLLHKSINILTAFCMPLILFSMVFAPQIIGIVSGRGYEGAVTPMRIVMPLMLIIGYEQILVIQTLMPLKKDRAILVNSIVGATVGVGLNVALVPQMQSVGSAVVWLLSECCVLASAQWFVAHYIGLRFPCLLFLKKLLAYVPMLLLLVPVYVYVGNVVMAVALGGAAMLLYAYVLNIHIIKDAELMQIKSTIVNKLKQRGHA